MGNPRKRKRKSGPNTRPQQTRPAPEPGMSPIIRYAVALFILLVRFGFGNRDPRSFAFTFFLLFQLGLPSSSVDRAVIGRILILLMFLYFTEAVDDQTDVDGTGA